MMPRKHLKTLSLVTLLGIAFLFAWPPIAHLSDITADWPSITDDDGSGTTGTVFNLAFFNTIKTAINNQVKSSTNPTITPAAMIDEVVTARGNKASLNARLSTVIDADGALLAPSSLVSATQYQHGVGHNNIIINGNFDRWNNGNTVAPNGWSLLTNTIVRTGTGQADTFNFGTGNWAIKQTRAAGLDGGLTQTVVSTSDFAAAYSKMKGMKVSASVECKTSIASHARIMITDGATSTYSSYHTGGGTAEHLSVTHTISSSGTTLSVQLLVGNSNGDAYFGGVMAVFSDLAPSQWLYGSATGDQIQPNRALYTDDSSHSNVSTSATDLATYTIPANTIDHNGEIIRITAGGTFAANGNTKTVTCYFGGTTQVITGPSALNGGSWFTTYSLHRTAAATQSGMGSFISQTTSAAYGALAATSDTTADIIVKCTGTSGTASSDVTQTHFLVEDIYG
jgi:hypothetical protein